MVRKLQRDDINRVGDIWLDTNIRVHDFIPTLLTKLNLTHFV